MALIRILVDGYSLLHNWPELASGQPRHSERARNELVHVLTRYHDATGTPSQFFLMAPGRLPARRSVKRMQQWKFYFRARGRPPTR